MSGFPLSTYGFLIITGIGRHFSFNMDYMRLLCLTSFYMTAVADTNCRQMDPPEDGYIANNQDYLSSGIINFACNTGYRLEGNDTLVCRQGQWKPPSAPSCQMKTCPEFPGISHGRITTNETKYGTEVGVICDNGYILIGLTQVRCRSNGQFQTPPTCRASPCGSLPGLTSPCVAEVQFREDNTIGIRCAEHGTFHEGSDTDTINRNYCNLNKWTNPNQTCMCGCFIKKSDYMDLTDAEGNYIKHNTELKWTCSKGKKSTTAPVRCENGTLNQIVSCTTEPDSSTTVPTVSGVTGSYVPTGIHVSCMFVLVSIITQCFPSSIYMQC